MSDEDIKLQNSPMTTLKLERYKRSREVHTPMSEW